MNRIFAIFCVAWLALGSLAACKSKRKEHAQKRPAPRARRQPPPARPRPGQTGPSQPQTWALVARLPLEVDIVAYGSLAQVRRDFPGITGLLSMHPAVRAAQEKCGIGLDGLPDELAAAASFDSRRGMALLTGAKFQRAKWLECVAKLLKEQGVAVERTQLKGGRQALRFSRGSIPVLATTEGPAAVLVAWGSVAEALSAGKPYETLGAAKGIRKLVAAVGRKAFWVVSLGVPPQIASKLPNMNAVQQIRALGFGLDVTTQGVALSAVLDMRSQRAAAQLASTLQRFLPGLDRFSPKLKPLKPVFDKLKTRAEANLLTLKLSLTWAEIGKLRSAAPGDILPRRP